jgi:putative zinc finger/helix-turn-helix YgiT family protein
MTPEEEHDLVYKASRSGLGGCCEWQNDRILESDKWICGTCGKRAMSAVERAYETTIEHDGVEYKLSLPALRVHECSSCGAVTLDDDANREVSDALRSAAGLLSPTQIRDGQEALGLSQKQLADFLKVGEHTLARWEKGVQIQQMAHDMLVRAFFDLPALREYLGWMPVASAQPRKAQAG